MARTAPVEGRNGRLSALDSISKAAERAGFFPKRSFPTRAKGDRLVVRVGLALTAWSPRSRAQTFSLHRTQGRESKVRSVSLLKRANCKLVSGKKVQGLKIACRDKGLKRGHCRAVDRLSAVEETCKPPEMRALFQKSSSKNNYLRLCGGGGWT